MTTKVIISCPADSHKRLRVGILDISPRAGPTGEAGASSSVETGSFILGQGETSSEVYVYDSRQVIISEVD